MTRPPWLAAIVAVLALVGLVAVGQAVPAPPQAAEQPRPEPATLTGAAVVCPALDVPEARTDVAAVALPGVDDAAPADTAGQVEVVALSGAPATEPLLATSDRGQTVRTTVDTSALVRADGALATGLSAQSTVVARGERTTGLADQPCVEPAREWWFVAGSGEVGRRATLVLANPSDSAAVVDVEVWTENGPLGAAGTRDLGVPAGGTRVVSVDAAAVGNERTTLRVVALVGRVGAALGLRQIDGADPAGITWVTPSEPPTTVAYLPGLSSGTERTLRLLNPGEEDAIAGVRVLGAQAPYPPVGLAAIDLPAGQVVDVALDDIDDDLFAVEVSANSPVVSSVTTRRTGRRALGDLAVVGSTPALDSVSAAAVTTRGGRSSRLLLTALPSDAVPMPPDAAATTPTPPATASATATATATATPTPTPAATPAPSATADPPATTSTQVVVRVVDQSGATRSAQVVTVPAGTTLEYPVELPRGVPYAWVMVEPQQPETVIVARETTARVTVPDPLDPDSTRPAFWYDVAGLSAARQTVLVPAVVEDLAAGQRR